jgi:hypothetical protein
MTSILRLTLFSILSLAAMTSPGAADNKIKSGILDCDVSAGVGSESSREADHELQIHPAGWRTGSIDEIGLSIGATEGGVLVWSVISAQQGGVPAGALAGKYTGLSADASVGIGLGENILIGGNNSAFMLQPTSYEGQVGLNVAAGVTTVTLTWAQ